LNKIFYKVHNMISELVLVELRVLIDHFWWFVNIRAKVIYGLVGSGSYLAGAEEYVVCEISCIFAFANIYG
jgi:hypothetical protein